MFRDAFATVLSWLGMDVVHVEHIGTPQLYREQGRGLHPAPPTTLPVKRGFDYSTVKSWCCMSEFVPGCNLVYVSKEHSYAPTMDRYVQTLAVVGSNVAMLIPAWQLMRRYGLRHERSWTIALAWLTAVSSALYHHADTWAAPVFGLSAGQWHRVDNLGAIGSMQLLGFFWSGSRSSLALALMFITTIVLQEAGPWKLEHTLIPVAVSWVHCAWCLFNNPAKCRALCNQYLPLGAVAWVLAFACFAKGLDDDEDHLRLFHSGWHVFLSAGGYWWLEADFEAERRLVAAAAASAASEGSDSPADTDAATAPGAASQRASDAAKAHAD